MPDLIDDKISWQSDRILQGYLDEDVCVDAGCLIQELPGMFDMFYDMAQNRKVKSVVFIGDVIAVEDFAFS